MLAEATEVQDYVCAADYVDAIEILAWVPEEEDDDCTRVHVSSKQSEITEVGREWRIRAIAALHYKMNRYLRGSVHLSTEQMAMAEIHRMAKLLKDCAVELAKAANRLNKKGDAFGANQAFVAAKHFEQEALDATGEQE